MQLRRPGLFVGALVLLLAGGSLALLSRDLCLSTWSRYDVHIARCPEGDLKLGVEIAASSLRRGSEGTVEVAAFALHGGASPDQVLRAPIRRFEASLHLVVGDAEQPLQPAGEVVDVGHGRKAFRVKLPADLKDGDHLLRAKVKAALGEAALDAPLPVYAPARIHLVTDRPLYEPGHVVKMRAVLLRSKDATPIDDRPGRFQVVDPTGTMVHDERTTAGAFGVAGGELALDEGAPTGEWTVRFVSGQAVAERRIRVEPFTLPRMRVEARPERPYYRKGQTPRVRGRVAYASGAAARSSLTVSWRVQGAWPPPLSWSEGGLPESAETDEDGSFELVLPVVPDDVQGEVVLHGRIDAVDQTGDRVVGAVSVLLAEHGLSLSAVTELEGGLVEGFDNRLYLRAATPAGQVLSGVALEVKRAWDPMDRGETVTTDEDGVAALQIDPGRPVNIVLPPVPYRPPPEPPPIERTSAVDKASDQDLSLKDLVALDGWNARLPSCRRFVHGSDDLSLHVAVDASGAVRAVTGASDLERCAADALRGASLPPGAARLLELSWVIRSALPTLSSQGDGSAPLPPSFERALGRARMDARACLPRALSTSTPLPRALWWRLEGARLEARFEDDRVAARSRLDAATTSCVERLVLAALAGRSPEATDGIGAGDPPRFGFLRFTAHPGGVDRAAPVRAQPRTMLGYELLVTARAGDEVIGEAPLRLHPGRIPPLRLRATPVLAKPGDGVEVKLLRGPDFAGEIPEKLSLVHEQQTIEATIDPATRAARFVLPAGLSGWFEASLHGAVARVFVPSTKDLDVEVEPDQRSYPPGAQARLRVKTTQAGAPVQAAVGLIGVDETLGMLAALPGEDDLQQTVRVPVAMQGPAFGALEAVALAEGRVRGANAAAAVVLMVSSVPRPEATDSYVQASAETTFDPLPPLVERFYEVLGDVHARVRRWEETAPKDEDMTAETMAALWDEVLEQRARDGRPAVDAFGRRLSLRALPHDLLALVDPRVVVVDGKRLPEDVESWIQHVQRRSQ